MSVSVTIADASAVMTTVDIMPATAGNYQVCPSSGEDHIVANANGVAPVM